MPDKYFDFIIHGGDYNPDQWIKTKEIWDEDMRLMKLSHVNSATIGIFSWAMLEPEEGVYNFGWLDEIMDKAAENGISVILATPSGARPAWMAKKYPEVLRVEESGIRNEYGVRHNHCLTSPVYREKVRNINRKLAERYKNHPALKMWHISNEYSGECHCPLCQQAFREWLKEYYHNDLDELNDKWWNGFWAHQIDSWDEISSPKFRGENHVSALKLCWKRFVTDSHISFLENEIAPLREITPDIPVTTNMMRMYDGINYQKMAEHLDIISWDNYPAWGTGDYGYVSSETAFVHDTFRSMKDGKPFFMMESTPSIVNWFDINKIPAPGTQTLGAVQAVAYGADSVQYFQWRKARGGHEKYHGAVVDHCGHENNRVFREITKTGEILEKLGKVAGGRSKAKVAVICDWENIWATKYFCGYNNKHRDYVKECVKWYAPFRKRGITTDVISADSDFGRYDVIIAPFLYMLRDDTEEKIKSFVENGGTFLTTYLFGCVDTDDRCYLGGFPANGLKDVFGMYCEETDSIPENLDRRAGYNGREYKVNHICDIIHSTGAKVLGEYRTDFYAGEPSVTVNEYGKGKAYYVAFRNDDDLADDICKDIIAGSGLKADVSFDVPEDIAVRKRGDFIFVMNFTDEDREIRLDKEYRDVLNDTAVSGTVTVGARGFLVIE